MDPVETSKSNITAQIIKGSPVNTPNNFLQNFDKENPKRRNKKKLLKTLSSSKNELMLNFGKAICSFAASKEALPYLAKLFDQNNVERENFIEFVCEIRDRLDDAPCFYEDLIPSIYDSHMISAYKFIFREIGKIFIKYFSIDWIYHGVLKNKEEHYKFRLKMMRRLQTPLLYIIRRNN